ALPALVGVSLAHDDIDREIVCGKSVLAARRLTVVGGDRRLYQGDSRVRLLLEAKPPKGGVDDAVGVEEEAAMKVGAGDWSMIGVQGTGADTMGREWLSKLDQ
ncbi:MAG: hypothetical protein L6R40_008765, partial [Gallowayella cf. fulva]